MLEVIADVEGVVREELVGADVVGVLDLVALQERFVFSVVLHVHVGDPVVYLRGGPGVAREHAKLEHLVGDPRGVGVGAAEGLGDHEVLQGELALDEVSEGFLEKVQRVQEGLAAQ